MAKYKRQSSNNSNRKSSGGRYTAVADEVSKEIEMLNARIATESPDRGYAPPLHQHVAFRSLPLSEATLRGLEGNNNKDDASGKKQKQQQHQKSSFVTMTDIQNACIPHALAGRDILGAARTGSGKTLAFLIPLLEKLHRARYSPTTDGPGAIVLSPTRELAVQIFKVLRQVGMYHALSAGLLVGGKKEFHLEQRHVGTTNILIATPGRLLQHLEQTPDLDTSGVIMLVLDEADRILDCGFRDQIVRILEYLPPGNSSSGGNGRQTLLFSATQTRRVSDLATLSLYKPEYLGVHDKEKTSTPENLIQSMVAVPLEHKLNAVYSFIKSHLKSKTILFLASCSQVRYTWELFCSLQPGIPVMALHGKLNQEKRTKVYFDFLQRPHAILFATDVAARGLDFPNVDWVVQVDAPEDKDMYIHRVGRTARYNKGGRSLLCVTPSEECAMTNMLQQARVPLKKLSINPTKTLLVTQRAASLVASNPRLNQLAKKAFQSYVRSVHLMPNKDMFNTKDLPLDAYATSLGLASTPNIRFLYKLQDRDQVRSKKNVNHKLQKLKEQIKTEKLAKKIETMGGNNTANDKNEKRLVPSSHEEEEEEDLLVVKKKHDWNDKHDGQKKEEGYLPDDAGIHEVTKSRHAKKIRIHGSNSEENKRIVFNEEGQDAGDLILGRQDSTEIDAQIQRDKDTLATASEDYLRQVRERLETNIAKDRAEEKERIREKHRKRRIKEKGEKEQNEGEETMVVTLGGAESEEEEVASDDDEDASSTESSSDEDEESDVDVEAQEDLALAMIRQNL